MTETIAPQAEKVPEQLTMHGDTRVDDYYWMKLSDEQKNAEEKDEQTQKVVTYLEAENEYTKGVLSSTEGLQQKLYDEIVARLDPNDQSVPVKVNGYWYYSRYEEGKEYPFFCRKKESLDADEEIMLNGPKMAEDHAYFAIGGRSVSEDNQLLVYGVDTVSRRQYTLYVKNLETGETLSDKIENTTGGATWANDNKTIFYTVKDPMTLRSYRIYKHRLGTDQSEDELVYEEKDETYGTFVYKSKSREYLIIGSYQTLASEYRILSADDPDGEWKVFEPRQRDHEYRIAHYEDHFYVVTNWDAKNFRLMKTPVNAIGRDNWTEVIAHRPETLLEGIEIFKEFLVVEERTAGLNQIKVQRWDGSKEYYMEFQDPTYTAYVSANPEFDTQILRYGYSSMTTPNSVYDFDMVSKERELLKQQKVLGGEFDPENYTSERLMVKADDGTEVPMSIVYRKGFKKDGTNPVLLYGYGSYGNSIDPYFSSVRLSLLDRGFAFAIAHIRGGQEMGRQWYEDGKLLKKKNTFTDFIDCGEYLLENGYTSKDHLYAMGGSAGGLLMGAVINMAPDMWNGVVAAVPFVDVVTTMLDDDIPLTTGEYDEWGNPNVKEYYDYIKSYSPYDNIKQQAYPNLLITTGYWDSQVQYWEPAKWIAKLRTHHQGDNLLLLHTNMTAGHGGASGRYERFKEVALEYAFMFYLEGIDA
ncbi:MAG: S9 family peptidase [Flavobacteriales bacterium]|nr:S9 family peptidase [Flavobacteriales bacterium]